MTSADTTFTATAASIVPDMVVEYDETLGKWAARQGADKADKGRATYATGATPTRVLRTLRDRFGGDVTLTEIP